MRARTWFAAILVVAGGAFTAVNVSGSTPKVDAPLDEEAPPVAPPRFNPVAWESPRPAPVRPPSTTRLSLRVVDPDGHPYRDSEHPPRLILLHAESRRDLDATADNTVTTELAPGTYEVEGYTSTLAGTTGIVELLPGDDLHADLRLTPGAHLRGSFTFPNNREEDEVITNDSWSMYVALADGSADKAMIQHRDSHGSTFDVFPFLPGKSYDVVFSHPGSRDVSLRGITAPSDGLTVVFIPLPTVRGAYGVPKGDPCPFSIVEVFDPDESFHVSTVMNEWCRFVLPDLPDSKRVRIQIPGRPDLDRDVEIPAHGDPPFVCLGGACTEPRPEDQARLHVSLDTTELPFQIEANYLAQPNHGFVASGDEVAVLDGLESGLALRVTLNTPGCAHSESTLQLAPGNNRLTLHCDPRRRIYVRLPRSGVDVRTLEIRCASEMASPENTALQVGAIRTLECPREEKEMAYRFSNDDEWRLLPLGEAPPEDFISGVHLPPPTDG